MNDLFARAVVVSLALAAVAVGAAIGFAAPGEGWLILGIIGGVLALSVAGGLRFGANVGASFWTVGCAAAVAAMTTSSGIHWAGVLVSALATTLALRSVLNTPAFLNVEHEK